MRILIMLLIISLPFVAFPSVGPIKLFDLFFLLIIINFFLKKEAKLPFTIIIFFLIFLFSSIHGYLSINYLNDIHILGGWNRGLLSEEVYFIVVFFRTMIYALGSFIASSYIFKNHKEIFPFMIKFVLVYEIFFIFLFLLPLTNPLVSNEGIYLKASFTEKGPYSVYVVFNFIVIMTYVQTFGKKIMTNKTLIFISFVTAISLFLCLSSRGTLLLLVYISLLFLIKIFNKKYFFGILLILFISIPFFPYLWEDLINKFIIYLNYNENYESANGRYAGLVLFPNIFSDYPWVGVGFGNYIFYRTSLEYGSFLRIIPSDSAENSFVQLLLEMGIFGFGVLLIILIFTPLKIIFKKKLWGIVPLFGVFLVSMTMGVPSFYQFWCWFYFLLGFLYFTPKKSFTE